MSHDKASCTNLPSDTSSTRMVQRILNSKETLIKCDINNISYSKKKNSFEHFEKVFFHKGEWNKTCKKSKYSITGKWEEHNIFNQ